jgi:predicted 3-demethylubiquinone-9 3-methyltransferase (glyoxalase superfamily)
MATQKIVNSLWYAKNVDAAAKLYASIFPDTRVDHEWSVPTKTPSGPEGSVKIIEMTIMGTPFSLMEAGPLDDFNHAISFTVNCDTQQEIDKYYNALLADGGKEENCGWVCDKFGVRWQIVTPLLNKMQRDPDKAKAKRVADAMLKMKKIDIAELKRAYEG